MTDTTTSPNMNLPVPVPSEAPGPAWATDIVTDMYAIDSHDHTAGRGVQIPVDGIDVNGDLPFGNNNAIALRSARFTAQSAPISLGTDLGCIYVSGKDLYYNDEDGNQIRITASGAVNGSTGTITGLPSGTASASFSAGTFTFQSATNTGATISAGPVAIGSTTAGGKQTTLASNAAQAANISLVLPTASPASLDVLTSDGSGNMSWTTSTGTNNVVRASGATVTGPTINAATINSPTINLAAFSSATSGTVVGGTYSPTIVNGIGTTTVLGSSAFYHRLGNVVAVSGVLSCAVVLNSLSFTITVPLLPTNNFSNTYDAAAVAQPDVRFNSLSFGATTSAKTLTLTAVFATASFTTTVPFTFYYSCA